MWLLHLNSAVKNTAFSLRFFSWRNTGLRHFVGYPCGTSRKKASTIFYDTAFFKNMTKNNTRTGFFHIYCTKAASLTKNVKRIPLLLWAPYLFPTFFTFHNMFTQRNSWRAASPSVETFRGGIKLTGIKF